MQQFNPYQYNQYPVNTPITGPNAVSINIITPQAYGVSNPVANCQPYYPIYGQNTGNMPIYPQNYNNIFVPQQMPQVIQNQDNQQINNQMNANGDTSLQQKTPNGENVENKDDKKTETKQITPLTDDYVKSLENYLNNDNPKIRLIGAKELLERFKECDDRKDNPSLIPLLNKVLKDTSSAVRFLGLTALQVGYCVGNDETIAILKQIQADNQDKIGEDALLASEILLKLSAGQQIEVQGNK